MSYILTYFVSTNRTNKNILHHINLNKSNHVDIYLKLCYNLYITHIKENSMKKNILKRAAATIFILIIFAFCSSCEQECAHEVFSENIIAPTCDSEGKTEHTCTACGYQFYTDSVAPLGHTLKTTIFEPTCEAEGYTYYSCDCGYSYTSDFIPSLGHEGEEKYVAPTCSAEGYTLVDCTRCNREYKKDFIPPISHNLKSEDFLPTCTEPGYTQY